MRKNISKVIAASIMGKRAKGDSKGTCSTDGKVIYSYAMPIARIVKRPGKRPGIVEIVEYERAPSATTRNQVSAVRGVFKFDSANCYRVRFVEKVAA